MSVRVRVYMRVHVCLCASARVCMDSKPDAVALVDIKGADDAAKEQFKSSIGRIRSCFADADLTFKPAPGYVTKT